MSTSEKVSLKIVDLSNITSTDILHSKPMLPSVTSLLHENSSHRIHPESSSPFLGTAKTSFSSDRHGVIRLPPLYPSRPQSLESALRHTASLSNILNSENGYTHISINKEKKLLSTPITPMIENKVKKLKFKSKSTGNSNNNYNGDDDGDNDDDNNNVHNEIHNNKKSPFNAVKTILTPSSSEKKQAFAFITHSQDTFGVKEPKIDNVPLARRKRRRTSAQELHILQDSFNRCSTPSKEEKIMLAQKCNMSEKAVRIWFQNKRQYLKKQKMNQKATSNLAMDIPSEESKPVLQIPSPRGISVVQLEFPVDVKLDVTPTKKSLKKFPIKKENSPMISSNNLRLGQSLTFHIRNEMKCLTPVKNVSSNKVTKLINNFNSNQNKNKYMHVGETKTSPFQQSPKANQQCHTFNVTPKKKTRKLQFKPVDLKLPLKELNINIFNP